MNGSVNTNSLPTRLMGLNQRTSFDRAQFKKYGIEISPQGNDHKPKLKEESKITFLVQYFVRKFQELISKIKNTTPKQDDDTDKAIEEEIIDYSNPKPTLAPRSYTLKKLETHNIPGSITVRSAKLNEADINGIRHLYDLVGITSSNIENILFGDGMSFESVGGMFNKLSAEEVEDLIKNGVMVVATINEQGEDKIIGFCSSYLHLDDFFTKIMDQDILSFHDNWWCILDSYLPETQKPILAQLKQQNFDHNPEKLKEIINLLMEIKDLAGKHKLVWALDVVVDPKYQRMGVAPLIEFEISEFLRVTCGIDYALFNIYCIRAAIKNGQRLTINQDNARSSRVHEDIMKAVPICLEKRFYKTIPDQENNGVWKIEIESRILALNLLQGVIQGLAYGLDKSLSFSHTH